MAIPSRQDDTESARNGTLSSPLNTPAMVENGAHGEYIIREEIISSNLIEQSLCEQFETAAPAMDRQPIPIKCWGWFLRFSSKKTWPRAKAS